MGHNKRTWLLWLVIAVVFCSRLPFINLGYGAEEDAWGLRLTAENIFKTGVYEVSRLPGHPFQELIYAQIWNSGFLVYNLLTVIISTSGILFFILSMYKLKVRAPLAAGIAMAFTPIIYINSMNAMDYTWAMSFILISFYFVIAGRMWLAGIFLGWAVGCRITSGAMLLPFVLMTIDYRNWKTTYGNGLRLIVSTCIVAALAFLPVYNNYGPSFFQYYEHFPIPGFIKNVFKGTIGVWGTTGIIMVVVSLVLAGRKVLRRNREEIQLDHTRLINLVCFTVVILYIIAFAKMPLKSAFMVPAVPFVVLFVANNCSTKWMTAFAGFMIFSCFTFGINLSDAYRGSEESSYSKRISIAGQQISIDPINGPVFADYTKQQRMINTSQMVISVTKEIKEHSVIIAGWYLNFIEVLSGNVENENCAFVYYINEETIQSFIKNGYHVYYLPLQEKFNDLRFKDDFTKHYARPLLIAD